MSSPETSLPILAILPELHQALQTHNQVILQAQPGAGKSTAVPLSLLSAPWLANQKIIMLEPRRLAAQSIARYLAEQLNEPVGQTIGYHIRNDKKSSAQTRLEIVTEGILIRRIQSDPELQGTALIIFDEFHERSIQTDLSLTFSLDVQNALREDLKLLIMSATLDLEQIKTFLPQAKALFCEGRQYPVEMQYYAPTKSKTGYPTTLMQDVQSTLPSALQKAYAETDQDILIFLPGKKEITQAIQMAQNLNLQPPPLCLPLYAGLSAQDQDLATRRGKNSVRKLIFSTNIAETSLTLPNIGCVIDSGLARQQLFDPNSGMSRLVTQAISQAASQQRCGRAGRLGPGKCYRLWSTADNQLRAPHETVEILRADLSQLCLEVALWGEPDPYNLSWLTPPPKAHLAKAKELLMDLTLLNSQGSLNLAGQQTVQMGLEPRMAKMLQHAQHLSTTERQNIVGLACDLGAILSEADFFKAQRPSADLLERLELLQSYRTHHKTQPDIQVSGLKQVLQLSQQWQKRFKTQAEAIEPHQQSHWVAELLAVAYPDRIAQRRCGKDANYLLSNGKAANVHWQDSLGQAAWLVAADVDGQKQGGRIFLACEISFGHLETLFAEQIVSQTDCVYDADKNNLQGMTVKKFKRLTLHQAPNPNFDASAFKAGLKTALQQTQLALLPWSSAATDWLKRVQWLQSMHPSLPDCSLEHLSATLGEWLLPYCTVKTLNALKQLPLLDLLRNRLDYEQQQTLQKLAPVFYTTPAGRQVPIQYELHRNPFVAVRLQELFGQHRSPILGGLPGIALTFELLSPAQRPLQITADLAHFWQNSYIEIAKEMRGRYPKHRWPENPLQETPGNFMKKR